MKKTFLYFVGMMSFILMSAGLSAMENSNDFVGADAVEIQGRPAYEGYLGNKKPFIPIGPLQLEAKYTIEGRKYTYNGFSNGGHWFYNLDDEQLILNQDDNEKWFITQECRNKEGKFISVEEIKDPFYSPLSPAPFSLHPPTLQKCLLQKVKRYGPTLLSCGLLFTVAFLCRQFSKSSKKRRSHKWMMTIR